MNLRAAQAAGLTRDWSAGSCERCGRRRCGADRNATECVACQMDEANATTPARLIPITGEYAVDAMRRS